MAALWTHTHVWVSLRFSIPAASQLAHTHFNVSICHCWRKICFPEEAAALLLSFLFSLWDTSVVLVSVYWCTARDTPASDLAEQTFAVIDTGRRRKCSIRKYCSPTGMDSNSYSERSVRSVRINLKHILADIYMWPVWEAFFHTTQVLCVQMN